jgi:hypothetical protein
MSYPARIQVVDSDASSSSASGSTSASPSLSCASSSGSAFTSPPDSPKDEAVLPAARDPHLLPDFAQTAESEPILYLPPLLSSLPASHSSTPYSASSPPTTRARLPSIDPASLALHKTLHTFRPLDTEYASATYDAAFNWADLRLPVELEREWYCVCFRSKRKAGSDSGRM